jgi:hypothetical protein
VGRRKERDGNREKCPYPPHFARLALQHPIRSVVSGEFARRQVFEMITALEQEVGCDLCVARVDTAAEFVEQLGFAEGAVCMPFSPPHFLAFDVAAGLRGRPVPGPIPWLRRPPDRSSGLFR